MENQIKVALVTGASRGIGRATALELAKKGYTVVINYAGNKEAADKVQNEIEKEGNLIYTMFDVIIKHLNNEYKNLMQLIWK